MGVNIELYTFEPYVQVERDKDWNYVSHSCEIYLVNTSSRANPTLRQLVYTAGVPSHYFEGYSGYSDEEIGDIVMEQFANRLREVLS